MGVSLRKEISKCKFDTVTMYLQPGNSWKTSPPVNIPLLAKQAIVILMSFG
jgi:hypothetical protein